MFFILFLSRLLYFMIDLGVSGVSLPLWFVHYGNQAVCSFIPVMSVHCSKNRPH